jgi:hypothetical protein
MMRLAAAAVLAAVSTGAAAQGDAGMGVNDLLQNGWTIIDKVETKEEREGLPPYENLTRVVQINTYTLAKAGKTMVCRIAYDSQQDSMTEACEAQD